MLTSRKALEFESWEPEEDCTPGAPVLPLGSFGYSIPKELVILSSDDDDDAQTAVDIGHITRYIGERKNGEASTSVKLEDKPQSGSGGNLKRKNESEAMREFSSSDDGESKGVREWDESSDSTSNEEYNTVGKNAKRYPKHLWNKVEVERVKTIPGNIDGLRVYEITKSGEAMTKTSMVRDGRKWKKSSQTRWVGYDNVRYSDCSGSYMCTNSACEFRKEYGVINKTHFDRKKNCSVCGSAGKYVKCDARRYIASCGKKTRVYHCGKHTCPTTNVEFKDGVKEEVSRQLHENPNLTPSQIQSNLIISKMKQGADWDTVEKTASAVTDKKSISNEKQKVKASNEPHGHNYEAVAHFKQYADKRDPFYVYSINDRRGNPNKPSLVFKSSTLKAQFALKMDRTKDNALSEEVCFFDGKVSRCKGFVSLTASVYHPLLQRVVPLATMECEAEDSLSVEYFWKCFNEVLQKVSGKKDYLFNPCGWITDMAGANMEGLKRVFGSAVLEQVKTCEFHFKECRNRQSRKFNQEVRGRF
ncbi:uncharacterized protein LOC114531204 [Dendronephthya gigantea]|uniref:uncharacterized protein LOC114531204 n=1 Tax=Dendronephthya gigantea TaxID=151771 RepID=UPI00106D5CFD|nr:uncharacterized protein LOC114531204 [Dendronephthya gigantea]